MDLLIHGQPLLPFGCDLTDGIHLAILYTRHFLHSLEFTVREKVLEKQPRDFFSKWTHGVLASQPLSMRDALGSVPSVSSLSGCIAHCVERLTAC